MENEAWVHLATWDALSSSPTRQDAEVALFISIPAACALSPADICDYLSKLLHPTCIATFPTAPFHPPPPQHHEKKKKKNISDTCAMFVSLEGKIIIIIIIKITAWKFDTGIVDASGASAFFSTSLLCAQDGRRWRRWRSGGEEEEEEKHTHRERERNRCVTVNPFVVAKQPNWHPTVSHRRIFS